MLVLPGWNELLIASFSHRSIALKDGVLLTSELQRDGAHSMGVGAIFDRFIQLPVPLMTISSKVLLVITLVLNQGECAECRGRCHI